VRTPCLDRPIRFTRPRWLAVDPHPRSFVPPNCPVEDNLDAAPLSSFISNRGEGAGHGRARAAIVTVDVGYADWVNQAAGHVFRARQGHLPVSHRSRERPWIRRSSSVQPRAPGASPQCPEERPAAPGVACDHPRRRGFQTVSRHRYHNIAGGDRTGGVDIGLGIRPAAAFPVIG